MGTFLFLLLTFVAQCYYNIKHTEKGENIMAKKSVTPSIRLNEDDYLKLKALKDEYGISWTKFIEYANKLIEKDMQK